LLRFGGGAGLIVPLIWPAAAIFALIGRHAIRVCRVLLSILEIALLVGAAIYCLLIQISFKF